MELMPDMTTHAFPAQALVGERLRDVYRSSVSKQQRAASVAPLWEEARTSLATPLSAAPGSSNGAGDAAADAEVTVTAVNQALKVPQLPFLPCGPCRRHRVTAVLFS